MAQILDPKEAYNVISCNLPNIVNYVKVVLKKEKLSEEAEAKRQKYEIILNSLEQGLSVTRPRSVLCDEDSGYFSANRSRGIEESEQSRSSLPFSNVSGYLLWQDEKERWRRCWCKAENRDMRFYVYEDNNEDVLLRSFSLENIIVHFEDQAAISGKDSSFLFNGVLFDAIGGSGANKMDASTSPVDVCFAAYTDLECKKWKDVLHHFLSTCESAKTMWNVMDGSSWPMPTIQDSASSSSSNFSSNRDSVISNTSSLINTCRLPTKSELEHSVSDNGRTLSIPKQQQPLPSPPHQLTINAVPSDDDSASARCEDEDNVSVGTIYESIDNLVLQFDDAIRNMGESMKPSASNPIKPLKKKEKSIFRQHSFLLSRNRNSKPNLWSEKRAEFEKGERFSSFMLKKNNSGSWKKKWCVLKGCVFGYYKSKTDSQGREFIILNGKVQGDIQDDKKSFVFSLSCKGVPEMFFSVDDQDAFCNWISKLQAACASVADYSHALKSSVDESTGDEFTYNVPRSSVVDPQLYDTPRGNTAASPFMTPDAAIDSGIYNVPRSILMQPLDDSRSSTMEDMQYLLGGNPLDIYDYPRVSISPDEEGIYDDPLDIIDMEIYDYPPDASELGIEEYPSQSHKGDYVSAVPPLPSSSRPSVGSFVEDNQDFAVTSDDQSKSNSVAVPSEGDPSITESDFAPTESSLLEYGQCALRGYLFKKERFMTWVKLFCIIRNNFLECHKSHGDSSNPTLKLFLPGSEVKEGGGDAKKKWAFQIRHPRREGILVFAADCEADLRRWMKAFNSGTSIQVQPVSTVEEIRITDLDMQKRWTTLDKSGSLQSSKPEETLDSIPPRRKTFSAGTAPEDYSSDTLKRRKKFSWVKSNFMRRKNDKKVYSGSQIDLNANRSSSSTLSGVSDIMSLHGPDPLRKSVSLELLPTATDSDESLHILDGENFQGYLRVQRKGADNVWVRYWCVLEGFTITCYISQRDLTLALSIQLQGSRVAESATESLRKHSFKVLHVESGQCLYFAADNHEEFFRWFNEITKFGHQVVSDDSDTTFGPNVHFFLIPKDPHLKRLSVVSEGGSSNFSEGSTGTLGKTVFYRGELLKASHTGKWKQRYCIVNGGSLGVFHSSMEKSPIVSIPLKGVSLELVNTTHNSKNEFQFKLNPNEDGKSHTFAAPNETEMYAWVSALRDASSSATEKKSEPYSPTLSSGKSVKRKSKKLKDADLISYIPASSLGNSDYSSYCEIQFGTEPCTKYWCVAFGNCLYIYQSKSATSTVKTVVLPGYEIKPGKLHGVFTLSLHHEGVSPVVMCIQTQEEYNSWASVLQTYTRAEGNSRHKKVSGKWMPENVSLHKTVSRVEEKKKGPMKADHSIRIINEVGNGEEPGTGKLVVETSQDLVIRRYEKRIRKTHKVANQTEQKLKKQQASLLHFKKELSRHVIKLQELSSSGDPHAVKRLKSIRMKLAQLDKIVPYLGKYISVNRQAEMQTIAVLKESCTVELQKLQGVTISKPTESKPGLDYSDSDVSLPTMVPPDSQNLTDNPYASLTEAKQEATTVKLRSNYAELDFNVICSGDSIRPPSVKYSEVRIDPLLGTGTITEEVQPTPSSHKDLPSQDTSSVHGTILTTPDPSNQTVSNTSHSLPEPELSIPIPPQRVDSISTKSPPPPVAKKPASRQSPSHTQNDSSPDGEVMEQKSALSAGGIQGAPSIMDRIKALQQ